MPRTGEGLHSAAPRLPIATGSGPLPVPITRYFFRLRSRGRFSKCAKISTLLSLGAAARPNGCARRCCACLCVIDTGFTDGQDNPSHIRVFDVDLGAGKASNSKVFAEMPKPSITDGMRADTEGNIWCSMGWGDPNEDDVRCYNPAGELLGKIHIPETVANLTFGSRFRNRLYICGSTSLYAVYTSATGAMKP